jgi:hypothetical protein
MYILFLVSIFVLIILPQDNRVLLERHESWDYVDICFRMASEFTKPPNLWGRGGIVCVCVCVCEGAGNVMLQHHCLHFISD